MDKADSVPVPMVYLQDGREFITDEAIMETPEIGEFVRRFSNYFTRDVARCGYVGPSPEAREAAYRKCPPATG